MHICSLGRQVRQTSHREHPSEMRKQDFHLGVLALTAVPGWHCVVAGSLASCTEWNSSLLISAGLMKRVASKDICLTTHSSITLLFRGVLLFLKLFRWALQRQSSCQWRLLAILVKSCDFVNWQSNWASHSSNPPMFAKRTLAAVTRHCTDSHFKIF